MFAIVYISIDGTFCMSIHLAMQCLLRSVSSQESEGVVYFCVRGFNFVSICSTGFWIVLTMVVFVFHFINVLLTFNLLARCALLKQNRNLR